MKALIPILIGLLVVGCGKGESDHAEVSPEDPDTTLKKRASGVDAVAWVSDPNDPNNVKIETAIRRQINKPTGELTKVDSEKVTVLNLRRNELTNVNGLEKLANLEVLFLNHNQLTDVKGLEKLSKLSKLIGADLSDNPDLTKTQIAELQKALPNCDIKSNPSLTKEESAKVIEAAIREDLEKPTGELTKENLEKVKGLLLRDNELTDVKGIEKLTQLTELNLGNNQLTDVKGLEKLKQLETLVLFNNTALTKAQIAELRKALPECFILTP